VSTVRIDHVAKRFDVVPVVADVALEIAEGELLALLGPSGSGKTTLLRLIAGFESVDAGRIFVDGEDVTERSAAERRCGMVFQHYALFPHLTVGANVRYGLAGSGLSRGEQSARVDDVLALVDLAGYQMRDVAALSGGQQQRVALARALAPRPRVLLLDEPLSNLDPSLRERTRQELRDLLARTRITTILVTHEQEEAFDLAHRVAVLHLGRLEQVDTPERLYQAPATPFVASFVGRVSMLTGDAVDASDAGLRVRAGGGEWLAVGDHALRGRVILALRPDAARFASDGALAGRITHRRFAGATTFYRVTFADDSTLEVSAPADAAQVGDAVHVESTGHGAFAWPAGPP
jgi:ABC-type Fe3+/spermidine/putrescine transport system ATPase subunit